MKATEWICPVKMCHNYRQVPKKWTVWAELPNHGLLSYHRMLPN